MSQELANLTARKNVHTPVCGVGEFACLSVMNFDLNYRQTGKRVPIFASKTVIFIKKKLIFFAVYTSPQNNLGVFC